MTRKPRIVVMIKGKPVRLDLDGRCIAMGLHELQKSCKRIVRAMHGNQRKAEASQ